MVGCGESEGESGSGEGCCLSIEYLGHGHQPACALHKHYIYSLTLFIMLRYHNTYDSIVLVLNI